MEETRITASNPDYEEINNLSDLIAKIKNPHMIFGFHETEIPATERGAIEAVLKGDLPELLEFNQMPFNQALEKALKKRRG